MTQLDAFTAVQEVRRDQYGRYLVVPPEGGKPVGNTRATTVAKTLDSEGGLLPWGQTSAVVGALRRPGLHARWQALLTEHPDPWYANETSKKACKQLVKECAEAGGSSDRAEIGIALHAIVTRGNRGIDGTPILQPGLQADLNAYWETVNAAGIVIDPTMVEVMVVLDKYRVTGTSDNLRVHLPGYGDVVADLKTGTNLTYSGQSNAIQLAIYAHGDNIYRQGPATDGSQDQRLPMPDVSQEHGLIIHLPAGEARCELHIVDLVAGWEAFQHSMWARGWRARRNLSKPLVRVVGEAATAAIHGSPTAPPLTAEAPCQGPAVTDGPAVHLATAGPSNTARRDQLRDRCRTVVEMSPKAAIMMADTWPEGAAGLTDDSLSAPELDAIERHIETFETAVSAPFAEPLPTVDVETPLPPAPAQPSTIDVPAPDEGMDVDKLDVAFTRMQARYATLDPGGQAWMAQVVGESIAASRSIHLARHHTVRRLNIVSGLIDLVIAGLTTATRGIVAEVSGIDGVNDERHPLGAVVSLLNADQSLKFFEFVTAMTAVEVSV